MIRLEIYTEMLILPSIYRIFILLCILCLPAMGGAQTPVLSINDTNAPPYTSASSDGFLDLILSEAMQRLGIQAKLVHLPAERALISANNGLIDGDLTRIEGLEKLYPNLVRVPERLVQWEFAAFSKDPGIVANWDSLKNYSVGYITGWKIYEKAMAGATHQFSASNPRQLFDLLALDRINVALHARWMGQGYISQSSLQDIHQLEPVLASRDMYLYLNKKHVALIMPLAQQLKNLKQEGFYQRAWDLTVKPYSNLTQTQR